MRIVHTMRALATATAVCVGLAGCAATTTAISKRNLDVQTKMSASILLDPVEDNQRTVLVQFRNTSDKRDFTIQDEIKAELMAKGYRIVTSPSQAHYILKGNILQVGKSDEAAAEKAFAGGFGGGLEGAVLGAGVAGIAGGENSNMAIGGLAGMVAGTVANAMVKDVYYSVITDIELKEKLPEGKMASASTNHNLAQGTSGGTQVSYDESVNYKAYQTRILSSANKVNLKFEEAQPGLKQGLATSVSGIF